MVGDLTAQDMIADEKIKKLNADRVLQEVADRAAALAPRLMPQPLRLRFQLRLQAKLCLAIPN